MKRIGCAISVVGVLLIGGSFALFGLSIMRAAEARQVASIPIPVGEETTTDFIDVDTGRLCHLRLQADIRTESVQQDEHQLPDAEPEFEARYDFPFQYTVLDADGNTIYSSTNRVGWNSGSISTTAEDVDANGGTVSVEHSYDKFRVAPPGRIRVRITIDPDGMYDAEAQNVKLNVYDNVSRQGASVLGGFAAVCFGPVLILTGMLVFFAALLSDSQRRNSGPHPPGESWESAGRF